MSYFVMHVEYHAENNDIYQWEGAYPFIVYQAEKEIEYVDSDGFHIFPWEELVAGFYEKEHADMFAATLNKKV